MDPRVKRVLIRKRQLDLGRLVFLPNSVFDVKLKLTVKNPPEANTNEAFHWLCDAAVSQHVASLDFLSSRSIAEVLTSFTHEHTATHAAGQRAPLSRTQVI